MEPEEIPPHRKTQGLFIVRGSRVVIPKGGLKIDLTGTTAHPLVIHIGLHLCPVWCEIALEHLLVAKHANDSVLATWRGTDDDLFSDALFAEFKTAMQAILGGATAVDALYSALREHVTIPDTTLEAWQRNRTARYKRVTEVLRQAFGTTPRNAVRLRDVLKQIYGFRDWVAHPPERAREPAHRLDIHMTTEWRFVAFSYSNARELVKASLSICFQASTAKKPASARVAEYSTSLHRLLTPTLRAWQDAYPADPLLTPEQNGGAG